MRYLSRIRSIKFKGASRAREPKLQLQFDFRRGPALRSRDYFSRRQKLRPRWHLLREMIERQRDSTEGRLFSSLLLRNDALRKLSFEMQPAGAIQEFIFGCARSNRGPRRRFFRFRIPAEPGGSGKWRECIAKVPLRHGTNIPGTTIASLFLHPRFHRVHSSL